MLDNDIKKVIKESKKKAGVVIPFDGLKSRFSIILKLKKYKKVGFLLDVDSPDASFPEDLINKFNFFLKNEIKDIENEVFLREFRVSKSFIKIAFYEGDELSIFSTLFDLLEGSY